MDTWESFFREKSRRRSSASALQGYAIRAALIVAIFAFVMAFIAIGNELIFG